MKCYLHKGVPLNRGKYMIELSYQTDIPSIYLLYYIDDNI